MNPLLSVRDLEICFPLGGWRGGSVLVVRGVGFDLERGQTLAVVGESGSGKTTLAMGLCGLVPVSSGHLRFDGQPLVPAADRLLPVDRRRIAMMFQDPVGSLSPRMRVGRLLEEPFAIHGVQPLPARELLGMVGLPPEFADRYPHQLSGGQARRIGLARALALKPDLVIADEPTAGLDVSIQGEVLNLLAGLQRELSMAMLIITHNLNIVRHVAQDLAVMYLGRFVEQGNSATLLDHPAHPYTAALLSANPSPDPDARRERIELRGEAPGLSDRPAGCPFHPRCHAVQARCREESPAPAVRAGGHAFSCHFPVH